MELRSTCYGCGLWPQSHLGRRTLLLSKVRTSKQYLHCLLIIPSELIYPRNVPPGARSEVPRPAHFGMAESEELMLPTPDGETISAFLISPENKSQARNVTVIMFHGNAGNIGHRLPIAKVLSHGLNCNVFMVQYRGYGLSSGKPNEKGIAIDAQTGLDYLRRRNGLKSSRFVLYGQSLGGAVASYLAAHNQQHGDIAGIILENTFLSIPELIPRYGLVSHLTFTLGTFMYSSDHPPTVLCLSPDSWSRCVTRLGQLSLYFLPSKTFQFCF